MGRLSSAEMMAVHKWIVCRVPFAIYFANPQASLASLPCRTLNLCPATSHSHRHIIFCNALQIMTNWCLSDFVSHKPTTNRTNNHPDRGCWFAEYLEARVRPFIDIITRSTKSTPLYDTDQRKMRRTTECVRVVSFSACETYTKDRHPAWWRSCFMFYDPETTQISAINVPTRASDEGDDGSSDITMC